MSVSIAGKWFNQHGSELSVEVDDTGHVRGTFRSGTGFPGHEEEFPVTGLVAGDLVGFTVSFSAYDSLTSWTGHLGTEDGRETLYALWHMSVRLPASERRDHLWQGIWSGADTFRRTRDETGGGSQRAPSHPTR